jgi:hypothetical protein
MKWFKHEADARNSLKLRKVRRKYGADGYAIYWFCLEAIAYGVDKDNLTFDLKEDAETIGFELSVQESRVTEIMNYMINVGLFESSNNTITCLKFAERLDKSMTNSPKMRAWLQDQTNDKVSQSVMTLADSVSTCAELDKTRLDKKRKEENILNTMPSASLADIENEFNYFWKNGLNNGSKKKALDQFKKLVKKRKQLPNEIATELLNDCLSRKQANQLGFDNLHTERYIRDERWKDEIKHNVQTQYGSQKTTGDNNDLSWMNNEILHNENN